MQIPDQNISGSEVSVHSNNETISTESMNVSRSLDIGWEHHVNRLNSGLGSNTTLNKNSDWVTNITSNEGSAYTHIPSYTLPALQLSEPRQITNDLRDDLICPITIEIFKEPVLASDVNNYEQYSITK